MSAISILMKPSSGNCNMNCDYCFYCDEAKKREQESYGFMSEQTLKNIVRKTITRADGVISFAFQGGEPTIRGLDFFEKFIEYERQYNKKGIRTIHALQTNGLILNEEWCRFLKKNHFLVGVSVDGLQNIHDLHRHTKGGEPTYGRVMKSIDLLNQYGVDYNILTVVNKQIAENIQAIYQDYKKRGFRYQQYIACLDPMDEPHRETEYALTPELYGDFLIQLFDLWYYDRKNGTEPYIRQFENYIDVMLGYIPEACEQRGRCGDYYVIEADGGVYPCDFYMTDEYYLGNFNQDKLPDLDAARDKLKFKERSEKISRDCRSCEHYRLCRGGCQRMRDYITDEDTYKNYFCESYRKFFDNRKEKLQEIVDQIRR